MEAFLHPAMLSCGALGERARYRCSQRIGRYVGSLTGDLLLDIETERQLGEPYTSYCTSSADIERICAGIPSALEGDL